METIRDAEVAELDFGGEVALSSAGRCQDPCPGKASSIAQPMQAQVPN
jgi:hypothetical protein